MWWLQFLSCLLTLLLGVMSTQFNITGNVDILYPVEQRVIDDLTDVTAVYQRCYRLRRSITEAHFLVSRLNSTSHTPWSPTQIQAVERILIWRPCLQYQQTSFAVCFQAFHDFDHVFSVGVLAGKVHMRVEYRPENPSWGWATSGAHPPRPMIVHNSAATNSTNPRTVSKLWATYFTRWHTRISTSPASKMRILQRMNMRLRFSWFSAKSRNG